MQLRELCVEGRSCTYRYMHSRQILVSGNTAIWTTPKITHSRRNSFYNPPSLPPYIYFHCRLRVLPFWQGGTHVCWSIDAHCYTTYGYGSTYLPCSNINSHVLSYLFIFHPGQGSLATRDLLLLLSSAIFLRGKRHVKQACPNTKVLPQQGGAIELIVFSTKLKDKD